MGHSAGDTLLRPWPVGSGSAAQEEHGGSAGGDEFALVVRRQGDRSAELAQTIRDVVRKPVRVDGLELAINGSIGITTREDGEEEPSDFLRRADVAMYRAKHGRHGVMNYRTDWDDFSRKHLRTPPTYGRA